MSNGSNRKRVLYKGYKHNKQQSRIKSYYLCNSDSKILNKETPRELLIHSDSTYCVNLINQWMFSWSSKDWKKEIGKEPENLDLVKTLYELMQYERAIKIVKIKGHAGHEFNERADELATKGTELAKGGLNEPIK